MNRLDASMVDEQLSTLDELYREELPAMLRQAAQRTLPAGVKRIYALGNGDSYHAALSAAGAFAQWSDAQYLPMPAYAFQAHTLPFLTEKAAGESLVACISASGSSKLAAGILRAAGEKGCHTLALTGRADCVMNDAARQVWPAVISEKGRTPGIRTYAASLCALYALAMVSGGRQRELEGLAGKIAALPKLNGVLDAARDMARRVAADYAAPHMMVLGSGALYGCASFAAAKLAEVCGVLALPQDLEEFCHVESMTYPLDAPVMILAGEADDAQAAKAAVTARRAGRRVIAVTSLPAGALAANADYTASLCGCEEQLLPLLAALPGLTVSRALAQELNRAMFLSDQPFSLF